MAQQYDLFRNFAFSFRYNHVRSVSRLCGNGLYGCDVDLLNAPQKVGAGAGLLFQRSRLPPQVFLAGVVVEMCNYFVAYEVTMPRKAALSQPLSLKLTFRFHILSSSFSIFFLHHERSFSHGCSLFVPKPPPRRTEVSIQ